MLGPTPIALSVETPCLYFKRDFLKNHEKWNFSFKNDDKDLKFGPVAGYKNTKSFKFPDFWFLPRLPKYCAIIGKNECFCRLLCNIWAIEAKIKNPGI